ncbi:MAG: 16S rRNA (adenine(1518)-N(6)/adenine(1519)-N(6))-dimethyltransferase RsmA [Pseudomonadota bacterium]
MFDRDSLPPLRDVVREHHLSADKKFGQNFLFDQNLTDKIVRVAGDLSDTTVIEIGPGPGGLTRSLLVSSAKKVIAIEFDERAVKALQHLKEAAGERFELIHADALNLDLRDLCDGKRAIIANLPYNIATPLLIGWLEHICENADAYASMALMFQKEVALRIAANLGDKEYGRLTVLSQWLCDAKRVFDVPASAFKPAPKVTSSIVHLTPKPFNENNPSFQAVETVTAAAFGQRRKMIRTSLKEYQPYFEDLGIIETKRAENLRVEDFIALANCK